MNMIPEEFLARFIIHLLSEKGVAIPSAVWKAVPQRLEPYEDEIRIVNETIDLRISSDPGALGGLGWAFGTPILRLYTI